MLNISELNYFGLDFENVIYNIAYYIASLFCNIVICEHFCSPLTILGYNNIQRLITDSLWFVSLDGVDT